MSCFPLAKVKSKANGLGRNMYANPPDVQVLGSQMEVAEWSKDQTEIMLVLEMARRIMADVLNSVRSENSAETDFDDGQMIIEIMGFLCFCFISASARIS